MKLCIINRVLSRIYCKYAILILNDIKINESIPFFRVSFPIPAGLICIILVKNQTFKI